MYATLPRQLRANLAGFARFGSAGAFVTVLGAAIYWGAADLAGVHPLAANLLAYVLCLAIGYVLHSKWSFPSDGAKRDVGTGVRYAIVSLASVALNSVWVWLLVLRLGSPTWWPIVPMIMVTPVVTFILYRCWVFRPAASGAAAQGERVFTPG